MNLCDMQWCPYCGVRDVRAVESGRALRCRTCARTLFENQAAAVGVALRTPDGRVAFAVRGRNPRKGKYDFPGGFVDRDESLEQAAVRELREELSIVIDASRLCYLCSGHVRYNYAGTTTHVTDVHFVLESVQDIVAQIQPADDVAQIMWHHPQEVEPVEMAFSSGIDVLMRLRDML